MKRVGMFAQRAAATPRAIRGNRRDEPTQNEIALVIQIRECATKHWVTLKQVESWLARTSQSPHVASKKTRLKMMLMRG